MLPQAVSIWHATVLSLSICIDGLFTSTACLSYDARIAASVVSKDRYLTLEADIMDGGSATVASKATT